MEEIIITAIKSCHLWLYFPSTKQPRLYYSHKFMAHIGSLWGGSTIAQIIAEEIINFVCGGYGREIAPDIVSHVCPCLAALGGQEILIWVGGWDNHIKYSRGMCGARLVTSLEMY